MSSLARWPRRTVIAGLAALALGAVDPLEGCVVILAGAVLVATGAVLARAAHRRFAVAAAIATGLGVFAMIVLSELGGIGGASGRSVWWAVTLIPYPIGWLLSVIAGVLVLREHRRTRRAAAISSGQPT